jgi:molybdopterin molybdotransferase
MDPTPDEAWTLIRSALRPLPPEDCILADAVGRRLASCLYADRDIPTADRAAMDGFALRAADLGVDGASMRIVGEIAAGSPPAVGVRAGECVRIFTGASVPPGADTVVRVEDTSARSFCTDAPESILVRVPPTPRGANIFIKGECATAGQDLLPVGAPLTAARIALAAACGRASVRVHRMPAVAVLATGAELLDPSATAPEPHQIRDSNGPLLAAACRSAGFPVQAQVRVADNPAAIRDAITACKARADVVLLTGGVSAGRYDYVRRAVEACGARVLVHGVAVQPGKPILFAAWPDGGCVFGLPGNPLSTLVGLYEFVLPALRVLAGCPGSDAQFAERLPLAASVKRRGDRWRCVPARRILRADGTRVLPVLAQGSADLVAGALAEGAAILPPGTEPLAEGAVVDFRPWGGEAP